jgi:hypothetical protein
MSDGDRFRKQAEECVQQAEKSVSLLDKETWLRVAAEWIRLAQSADERDGKTSNWDTPRRAQEQMVYVDYLRSMR